MPSNDHLPLYVDLDGTLIATDSLWENILLVLKISPLSCFKAGIVLITKGKAVFKTHLATIGIPQVEYFPYRSSIVQMLEVERKKGRRLILATAAHGRIARAVARHLGCFDDILATESTNLKGERKLQAIQSHAKGGFVYLGNDREDVSIWKGASERWCVGTTEDVTAFEKELGVSFDKAFSIQGWSAQNVMRTLRVQQWTKNILLFFPLLLAHRLEADVWLRVGFAFLVFSACASGVYIFNDLFDLEADRRHPTKSKRPLAAGDVSIQHGLCLGVVSFMFAALGSWWLDRAFFWLLLGYIFLTTIYTHRLKRLPIVDVLFLAAFYVYRLIVGGAVSQTVLSPWLFVFAAFFFLSLGVAKRYGELLLVSDRGETASHGRGYQAEDRGLLLIFGVNAAFLSLLVFTLYFQSADIYHLYSSPSFLWGVLLLMSYWLMRLWLLVHRRVVRDDPLVFTLKDHASWVVGAASVVLVFLATWYG